MGRAKAVIYYRRKPSADLLMQCRKHDNTYLAIKLARSRGGASVQRIDCTLGARDLNPVMRVSRLDTLDDFPSIVAGVLRRLSHGLALVRQELDFPASDDVIYGIFEEPSDAVEN